MIRPASPSDGERPALAALAASSGPESDAGIDDAAALPGRQGEHGIQIEFADCWTSSTRRDTRSSTFSMAATSAGGWPR